MVKFCKLGVIGAYFPPPSREFDEESVNKTRRAERARKLAANVMGIKLPKPYIPAEHRIDESHFKAALNYLICAFEELLDRAKGIHPRKG